MAGKFEHGFGAQLDSAVLWRGDNNNNNNNNNKKRSRTVEYFFYELRRDVRHFFWLSLGTVSAGRA